eukprot:6030614-Pyramimonas_sp.AAC.2
MAAAAAASATWGQPAPPRPLLAVKLSGLPLLCPYARAKEGARWGAGALLAPRTLVCEVDTLS